jgi:hypothetical protein
MKTLLSILTILFLFNQTNAQTTAIPDTNFEQALIDLGYDTFLDGQVLTANINTITDLNVAGEGISDLTGIQNFTSLVEFSCMGNALTSIDVTQNLLLEKLFLGNNQLVNVDITQNIALIWIAFQNNSVGTVDLSQNILLQSVVCNNNVLTSLNLTLNPAINNIDCSFNSLMCFNMKNGTNTNISLFNFSAGNNPSLTCIQVDDVSYANAHFQLKDFATSFSTNCTSSCLVGIEEKVLKNLSIYPNPTTGSINLDLEETKSNINLRLTNAIGQVVLTKSYKSTNHISFDLNIPKGVYFLQLETSSRELITRKIIKE